LIFGWVGTASCQGSEKLDSHQIYKLFVWLFGYWSGITAANVWIDGRGGE